MDIKFSDYSEIVQRGILYRVGKQIDIDLNEMRNRLPDVLTESQNLWESRENKGMFIKERIRRAVEISKQASEYANECVDGTTDESHFFLRKGVCSFGCKN